MPAKRCEILIAGAGLAGMSAAAFLADSHDIVVVDPGHAGSGSFAANGIVNPFMGRKARPIWKYAEALESFDELLSRSGCADLFDRRGVLRLASDEATAARYREVAQGHPDQVSWFDQGAHNARHAGIRATHGCLFVSRGGWIDVVHLVDRMRDRLVRDGVAFENAALSGWTETNSSVEARLEGHDRIEKVIADTILIAVGPAFPRFAGLSAIDLHAIKGQTVRMTTEADTARLPHVAGSTSIGFGRGRVVIGSTYDHAFTDLEPDTIATQNLVNRARAIAPSLGGATVVEVRTGVRATVPKTRKPVLGPLTDRRKAWIVSGLGSRGLLMGAFLGSRIADYLRDPAAIPAEIRAERV